MLKKHLLLIAALFCSLSIYAQNVSEAQANLMQFVGNWKLEKAKYFFGDQTFTGVYTFNCSAACDNTGILAHEKFITNEGLTITGENLLGYDPNTGQIHLYSIDNTGTTHDHYGYWVDKNHLFVQYQGVVEGKMYVEQIDFKFRQSNKMELNLVGMINGEVFAKASGTFTK
jgi:hypothetical protein